MFLKDRFVLREFYVVNVVANRKVPIFRSILAKNRGEYRDEPIFLPNFLPVGGPKRISILCFPFLRTGGNALRLLPGTSY